MKLTHYLLLAIGSIFLMGTSIVPPALIGNVGLINHNKNNIALNGQDVVVYFQNHQNGITNKGKRGSKKFSSEYQGVTYYFSSEENKNIFEKNPEEYMPAYGGWCAWAMAYGESRVTVNYNTFLIAPDANGKERLYLFYNSWGTNTLKKWLKEDHNELVRKSDITWQKELEKFKGDSE